MTINGDYGASFGYGMGEQHRLNHEAELAEKNAGPAAASEQARQQAVDAAPSPPANTYGGYDAMSGGSGFVSESELMLWLEAHSEELNGELRGLMNVCEARNQLVEDLGKVKSVIAEGVPQQQVQADVEQLLEEYAGSPYEQELKQLLQPVLDGVARNTIDDSGGFAEVDIENWNSRIQNQLDAYGKADQMDMLRIQDLTNRLREGFQLVSQMISGIHQTSMAIVGNVGR